MCANTAIIIGGGVIGISTAYHLARKQFGRIILLDKGSIGDGASRRAAGIATGLLWTDTGVQARQISLALFRDLSQDLDGYTFQDVGCLNFFDSASWPQREKLLPLYNRWSVPYEILDVGAIHKRWPDLTPPADIVGLYDPLGGYSEPDDYIPALAARAQALGVEIRAYESVTDFLLHNGRLTGVVTSRETVEADVIVSTVHVWTLQVLKRLGLQFPMKAFVHQRYVTAPLDAPVRLPAANVNPLGGYVRPAMGNRILVGIETAQRSEFHITSPEFRMAELSAPDGLIPQIQARFPAWVPKLQNTTWEDVRMGLISFSVDGEPILGPVDQLPGLYIGVAFHSGGFAYNPAAGLFLAQYVADGRPQLDLTTFSPSRFTQEETQAYLATQVVQDDAIARRH